MLAYKNGGEVVKESGLRVGIVKRYHLDTMWEVILRLEPGFLRKDEHVGLVRAGGVAAEDMLWGISSDLAGLGDA